MARPIWFHSRTAMSDESSSGSNSTTSHAGIAGQCLFQDLTDARWHEFFSVNVDGAFYASRAVLPAMLHAHEGCIVNISSIWGQRGASCEVAYSATKAALIGLTRSLAAELAPSHIRVNCVAPASPTFCPALVRR